MISKTSYVLPNLSSEVTKGFLLILNGNITLEGAFRRRRPLKYYIKFKISF